ncbi:unnamed protein product, partial [Nesidiocoris tenuis]
MYIHVRGRSIRYDPALVALSEGRANIPSCPNGRSPKDETTRSWHGNQSAAVRLNRRLYGAYRIRDDVVSSSPDNSSIVSKWTQHFTRFVTILPLLRPHTPDHPIAES